LSLAPATTTETSASYSYNPDDPAPTRGGAGMLAFILPGFDGAAPANVWQEQLCERADILSFLAPVAVQPTTISGTIKVQLDVASSAADTAFSAKLVEVMADGRAVNIRDSITSLGIQNGKTKAYSSGSRTSIDIRFWPIEWQLQPGSRFRLDISSSDFPKFHAHPNRTELRSLVESPVVAEQMVFGGLLALPMSN
jgi:putative CocE/NonD family hydrolase